ncbi:nitrogen fixation protein NifW, partial [Vibrio sp. 1403]|nr:nitrogen fixation protein NifW [Vibrio sp. 1403]
MSKNSILETINTFTSIEQALDYFEIGYESKFINEYRTQLV